MSEPRPWPPELLARVIKAMCPTEVCRICGEPRRRVLGDVTYPRSPNPNNHGDRGVPGVYKSGIPDGKNATAYMPARGVVRSAETLGFSDCGHDDFRPGVVLDPFAVSDPTGEIANALGRDAILIDPDLSFAKVDDT